MSDTPSSAADAQFGLNLQVRFLLFFLSALIGDAKAFLSAHPLQQPKFFAAILAHLDAFSTCSRMTLINKKIAPTPSNKCLYRKMELEVDMKSRNTFDPAPAVLVLNASLDLNLRENRARILNQAGFYTSSAESEEEVVHLAAFLHCPIVIVCHSFNHAERRRIYGRIHKAAPRTTVILLNDFADRDPGVLIDTVKKALQPQL